MYDSKFFKFEHGNLLPCESNEASFVRYEAYKNLAGKLQTLIDALPDTRKLLIAREDAISAIEQSIRSHP